MSDRIQNIQDKNESPRRAISRRGFLLGGVAVAGASAANLVDIDGMKVGIQVLKSGIAVASDLRTQRIAEAVSSAAADACPPLPTDGRPAPFCFVPEGTDLVASSRYQRAYFLAASNNEAYDATKKLIQGVPNGQLIVERLKATGVSDFVEIVPESRKIEVIDGKEVATYWDRKNEQTRIVEEYTVMKVPADGGRGLGRDVKTDKEEYESRLKPGDISDKVWGPIAPEARNKFHNSCGEGRACGWNCVDNRVVSRAVANVEIDMSRPVPSEQIYKDPKTGRLSVLNDYVYYFDLRTEPLIVDQTYINKALMEGDPLWNRENLTYKEVVKGDFIVPYTYYGK